MKRNGALSGFRAALESIGYDGRFVKPDYDFADFAATVNRIALAAFSSYGHGMLGGHYSILSYFHIPVENAGNFLLVSRRHH